VRTGKTGTEAREEAVSLSQFKLEAPHKCPMLGVPGDTEKYYVYPFGGNVCYASPVGIWKYGAISPERQRELCLTGKHANCPTYNKCTSCEEDSPRPSPSWLQRAVSLWRLRTAALAENLPMGKVLVPVDKENGGK